MESAYKKPMDIIRFVSMENEQFLVSLANNKDELNIVSHIQGLYDAAMSDITVNENEMVIFQMLTFTHYHFLFSVACLIRCHLSEAFASARAAIDGALVAAQIIHDRDSQIAYLKREKPFDNFARYLGNLIKDGKPLPHTLVPTLFSQHKTFSRIASHADFDSFMHRVRIADDNQMFSVDYFQFSKNDAERKVHALTLYHTFVMILDVFSDFLVNELKLLPVDWQTELRALGRSIERTRKSLDASLPKYEEDSVIA